jgi:hypothetical protein
MMFIVTDNRGQMWSMKPQNLLPCGFNNIKKTICHGLDRDRGPLFKEINVYTLTV